MHLQRQQVNQNSCRTSTYVTLYSVHCHHHSVLVNIICVTSHTHNCFIATLHIYLSNLVIPYWPPRKPLGWLKCRVQMILVLRYWVLVDPGAAITKPPPPVILLQVGVSRIYATESQPSVIFQSDSVSHIFNDWRRLSLYY